MKHLNEQNYQKGKKAIAAIGILIIVLGVGLGLFLITTGIIKMNSKSNKNEVNNIELLEKKIDELEKEEIQVRLEKNKEFDENQFSEKYYLLQNKLSDIREEISEAKSEIWKEESGYNNTKNRIESSKGLMYIIPGVMAIIFGFIFGGIVLSIAYGRNILAWKIQQVMPVAQESMETISPTIAKISKEQIETIAPAIGELAKEIKKGLQDDNKE